MKLFGRPNRERLHYIWRRAQGGKLDGLTEDEKRLAEIMLVHSDEYFNQFEFAEVLADREFNPEGEVNPFLHVVMHAVVKNQVKDRDPIEALQFYNAMIRNKCQRTRSDPPSHDNTAQVPVSHLPEKKR